MRLFKQNPSLVALALLEAALGILLIIDPINLTKAFIVVFGVILLFAGIIYALLYFKTAALDAAFGGSLALGLTFLCLGFFFTFFSDKVLTLFTFFPYALAVGLFFSGLFKLQWTIDSLRLRCGKWFLPLVSAILSILCAVVIFVNPFDTLLVLLSFSGWLLVAEAVLDILVLIFIKRTFER